MRVRCLANTGRALNPLNLDESLGFSESTTFHLTVDFCYTVLGWTEERGGRWYIIKDDSGVGYPRWLPGELFEVIDGRMSSLLIETEKGAFISEWDNDPYFWDKLTDGDAATVSAFDRKCKQMELEFDDPDVKDVSVSLGDGWFMCPVCDNSWQDDQRDIVLELLNCPSCNATLKRT